MSKDYSKYFAPSLKDARKRIQKETEQITFEISAQYQNMGVGKTYMIKTYGCQGNLADSEKIAGILEELGYQETSNIENVDVLIFNTCAIRANAENRIYGELGRLKGLKNQHPGMLICLCGCMPQEEVTVQLLQNKYKQVDIVFGTHNIHMLPSYLYEAYQTKERVLEVYSVEGNIIEGVPMKRAHQKKAWVDIMYGCDEFCTYCIVPYTRGKERSRNPQDILKEVEILKEQGYLEVTLLGQNVNAYQVETSEGIFGFARLLEMLAKTHIPRIRFTTSHPKDLDKATMDVMAKYPNIMPHLHLPVQSGSNTILKKMNRKYTKEEYLEKVAYLKSLIPDLALTTDIIVGFPYETDDDFKETLDLVEKAQFEGAYTFIYSPREGTPAAKYDSQVDPKISKERLLLLNKRINEGFLRGNARFEGKIVEVLVEGVSEKNPHLLTGYTRHNKLVNFEGSVENIGKIVSVQIEKAYTWHLKGKKI